MDGAMPIVDGFEATSNIRDMEKDKKRSVIIATTGLTSRADHQRFMEAGADAFLAKPIFAQELVALIRLLTMR